MPHGTTNRPAVDTLIEPTRVHGSLYTAPEGFAATCEAHFAGGAVRVRVDRDAERIESCRVAAERVGLDGSMAFRAAAIEDVEPKQRAHVVLALHACDVATDHAIAFGLRCEAELIAVAPCCQAELAREWARLADTGDAPLQPLWSTPHLRREMAATVTDAMRMLLLRAAGYETRVVEFVPSRHTPKNTLIRAVRRRRVDEAALDQYRALRRTTGGVGVSLERAAPLAALLARHTG